MIWLWLLGCGVGLEQVQGEHLRIVEVGPPASLDLVVLVDSSGTMQSYQSGLSELSAELHAALPADLRVAVGDVDVETDAVLSVLDQPDAQALQEAMDLGTTGSGTEVPLHEAVRALETPDLLRGGPVALLLITDEEDYSPLTLRRYARELQRVTPERGSLSVHTLSYSGEENCPTGTEYSIPSQRLPALVGLVGGSAHDLCDLPDSAQELARAVGQGRSQVLLDPAPVEDTVRVFLDDVELSESQGWELVREPAAAVLVDDTLAGTLRVVWEEAP